MALPIISDTSTLAKMALSAVVRTMCSGRTPRVTGPLSTPPSASRRHFSGESATVAPARDTWYRSPCRTSSASKKFIWGVPMNPATNRLAGWMNTSWGVPTCWM